MKALFVFPKAMIAHMSNAAPLQPVTLPFEWQFRNARLTTLVVPEAFTHGEGDRMRADRKQLRSHEALRGSQWPSTIKNAPRNGAD
jgi:hypothetical protein